MNSGKLVGLTIAAGVVFLSVLTLVFGSWFTVDQGERGVILRNGEIVGVAEPGWHSKMPIIDTVQEISVQTHIWRKTIESYSADQQPANLVVSVNYKARPVAAARIYAEFGTVENMIARFLEPRVLQQVKIVFGRYTATSAIQDRARLNSEALAAMSNVAGELVEIEGLQVEDIQYAKAYLDSIQQRMLAEVGVSQLRQQAEQTKINAEITVIKARADADATEATAKAAAANTRIRADAEAAARVALGNADATARQALGLAEAAAIAAKGKALADNPSLVGLTQAERWDGKLPSSMMPNSAIPIIGLGK